MPQAPYPQRQDTKRALLDARAEAVRAEASRADRGRGAGGPAPHGRWLRWLFLLTVAFGGYLMLAQPAWFLTPPPPPPPPTVADASLRIAVWQTAVRIRAFAREESRLPTTLGEAGAPRYQGVEYSVAGGDFSIRAVGDAGEVTYHSHEDLEAFLGNSLTVIASRGSE